MSTPASDRGRSNRQRGYRAELAFLHKLREYFPNADHQTGTARGDFTGVGDIVIEATTERWSRLGESEGARTSKINQARRDCRAMRYHRWAIVKRGDGADGWAWFWLEEASTALKAYHQLLVLEEQNALLMDELEQVRAALAVVTAEADEAYDRGMRKAMGDLGAALRGETG